MRWRKEEAAAERRWRGEKVAGRKCVATTFVSVRAAPKIKPKPLYKHQGGGSKSSWLASNFGGGLDFGARRVKKLETWREVLKSVRDGETGRERRRSTQERSLRCNVLKMRRYHEPSGGFFRQQSRSERP